MKSEKHKSLWEECRFYWKEIDDGTINFHRVDNEVIILAVAQLSMDCNYNAFNLSGNIYRHQYCSGHWLWEKHDRRCCGIQVAALQKLEKHELLEFFEETMLSSGSQRRKLSIQIYSHQHFQELQAAAKGQNGQLNGCTPNVFPACNAQSISIDNVHTFKRSQSLYGSTASSSPHYVHPKLVGSSLFTSNLNSPM